MAALDTAAKRDNARAIACGGNHVATIVKKFQKPLDKPESMCYNTVVPQGTEMNICWCGSMAEQLICNQQVVGSTPITSSIWGNSRVAKGGRL